jgi:type I restriction enzyme M protein
MTNDQKKQLEAQLWNIADTLRGKMNADEFRDYCLGFIFYKYLSERQYICANQILSEDDLDYLDIDENSELGQQYLAAVANESIPNLGYFLKPSELFHSLVQRALGAKKAEEDNLKDEDFAQSNFILDDLTQVLKSIEKSTMGNESEENFDNLFEDLDLTSTKLGRNPKDKNALIAKILVHLDKIDFKLQDSESDVLGDAYEYLIAQFATGAGKKAGEFYTPQAVSKVLAKIVTTGKTRLKSVYDPTCGSGSLLLRVAKEVEKVGDYFGQEMNRTTYNLARMNMILHDVKYHSFNLRQEDTLERPQHQGMKFEAVVANPPFSANWSANKLFESDDRFSQYGALAPKSKADFAFVQHMIHHLADNGIMAVVLPHGVLFRGATEGRIRQYLIKERNWLDAVIGLPANIFYGTSIPTCILVFKKCRENPDDILFIDGSGHFEKAKNQNYLRDEDINKIIDTYRGRLVEEKYSYRASLAEVAENDFNLNIPRYVDTFEEEADIDLADIVGELKEIDQEITEVNLIIQEFCQELNIDQVSSVDKGKKKVPLLRFPEFTGEWFSKYLEEIGDFKNGFNADKSAFGKGTEFVNLMDIFGQSEIKKTYLDRVEINEQQLEQYKIQKGDILFVRSSVKREGVGQSCLVNDNFKDTVYSGFIIRFREKSNDLYHLYKKYCFSSPSFRKKLLSLATSSANTNINQDSLSNILLLYPKIEEQEKIAKFLGECDRILTLLRRKRELLESYKRRAMQLLFTQKIRFKDDDGSDFPAWNFGLFYDCLDEVLDFRGRTPLKLGMEWGGGEIPSLSANNVKNGYIDFQAECNLASEELYQKWMGGVDIKQGDIIFTMEAPLGNATLIPDSKKYILSQRVVLFKTKNNIYNPFFIQLIWSPSFQKVLEKLSTGTTAKGINQKSFKKVKIHYPCHEEQEKIAKFLTAIDQKIEIVGRQIEGRGKFKQGLLQKMFI